MKKLLFIISIAVIASLNIQAQGYRNLSTEVIGGFTGVMLGLFAQGDDGYADFCLFYVPPPSLGVTLVTLKQRHLH